MSFSVKSGDRKKFKMKTVKNRNQYARELYTDKYHQRIVPSYKKYNRALDKKNVLKEVYAS